MNQTLAIHAYLVGQRVDWNPRMGLGKLKDLLTYVGTGPFVVADVWPQPGRSVCICKSPGSETHEALCVTGLASLLPYVQSFCISRLDGSIVFNSPGMPLRVPGDMLIPVKE